MPLQPLLLAGFENLLTVRIDYDRRDVAVRGAKPGQRLGNKPGFARQFERCATGFGV